MGRDRRNERRGEHYTKMTRTLMETEAWRSLPPSSQALYVWLKLEWRGPQANNNGKISLSVRQAAHKLGVAPDTAARAFHPLQERGFLFCTKPPKLGLSGVASCPEFELTELPLPAAKGNQGRRLYQDWRPGADFLAVRAPSRKPKRKPKTCHKTEDDTVIDIGTAKISASSKQ